RHQDLTALIRHIDLAPTILAWLGLPQPAQFQGQSLIPLIEGRETEPRVAYSQSLYPTFHYGWSPLHALTTLRYKLSKAPRPELYDRLADPGETKNLYDGQPDVVRKLTGQLEGLIATTSTGDTHRTAKLDPETEEKLRALGYMSAAFDDPEAAPVGS